MIHIAICDDDNIQIKITEKLIREAAARFSPEIDLFSDGEDLLRAIRNSDYIPELAVLDIRMPKSDGVNVAKQLNELTPDCRIIFLTSFLGYATEVYEARHSYFILKSQLADRIDAALTKTLEDYLNDIRISFREEGAIKIQQAGKVLYLERNLKKTNIVCVGGERHITAMKAEELLKTVPKNIFVQCHQSFWVNVENIRSMTADSFVMINGDEIPVSRSRKKEAKEAFFGVLSGK